MSKVTTFFSHSVIAEVVFTDFFGKQGYIKDFRGFCDVFHRAVLVEDGDVVIVTELSRLSRSVKDLFEIVEKINQAGADIQSLKETWINTVSPQGKLLFTIFAGISQFERDLIRQRTMEGLQAARARGRNGGRPPKEKSKIELAISMYDSKVCSISQILEATGISKTTLYRYVRQRSMNSRTT